LLNQAIHLGETLLEGGVGPSVEFECRMSPMLWAVRIVDVDVDFGFAESEPQAAPEEAGGAFDQLRPDKVTPKRSRRFLAPARHADKDVVNSGHAAISAPRSGW
jgi:hypothetical protein